MIGVLLGRETTGGEFGVAILELALPELALWGAGGVAVVGGGTEGFLFLVVADETEFNEDREEEEDAGLVSLMFLDRESRQDLRSDDGNGETGGVESACRMETHT
jgi:hypothetical protein